MATAESLPPTLLTLPLEIRHNIYRMLCRNEPVCYPFPNSPISAIDRGGPPRSLLLTCRKVLDEVQAYYYGSVTFRFLALGRSRVARVDISPGTLVAIRQARKVELMLMWNITSERARAGPVNWPFWMNGWLEENVRLLQEEGEMLEAIIISLRDASTGAGWQTKRPLLEPLRELKGKVRFIVGDIIAAEDVKSEIKSNLKAFLKELNR